MMNARTVHLQWVGDVPGTPAGEIEAGDHLMWNGGEIARVLAVEDASPRFVRVTEQYRRGWPGAEDGRAVRLLRKDRLVARVRVTHFWPPSGGATACGSRVVRGRAGDRITRNWSMVTCPACWREGLPPAAAGPVCVAVERGDGSVGYEFAEEVPVVRERPGGTVIYPDELG